MGISSNSKFLIITRPQNLFINYGKNCIIKPKLYCFSIPTSEWITAAHGGLIGWWTPLPGLSVTLPCSPPRTQLMPLLRVCVLLLLFF